MLLRLWRWLWPKEASQTPARRDEPVVTRDEIIGLIESALEEHMKDITFEWNEWYEKFDKLHLRLAKRASRAQQGQQPPPLNGVEQEERPVSALHFRRLGSV